MLSQASAINDKTLDNEIETINDKTLDNEIETQFSSVGKGLSPTINDKTLDNEIETQRRPAFHFSARGNDQRQDSR